MEVNYQQAFINIVKILFPNIEIDCVETKTFYKGDSRATCYSCTGVNPYTNDLIQIETKNNSAQGMQICIEITNEEGEVVSNYSVWSHSFNWKALGIVNNVISYND